MPVLVPVSVSATTSESPALLVTVTSTVSTVAELVLRFKSVTRMQVELLAGKPLVATPLLPLVNSVLLGVPRSRKMSDTLAAAVLVTPSVPSLAVAARL